MLAISDGPALQEEPGAPTTLPEILRRAAVRSPDKAVVYIQSDGTEVSHRYPDLLEQAERIQASLRKWGLQPQDKVLFQLDQNQHLIPAFWGCVLGGLVPVPLAVPPTYERVSAAFRKLYNAWQILDRPVIVTRSAHLAVLEDAFRPLAAGKPRIAAIEDLQAAAPEPWDRSCRPEELTLLLLTSGSTGVPKSVMLSHRNLLAQSSGSAQLNDLSGRDVSLNWMPMDHVAGIVKCHIRSVYLGGQQIHAPTDWVLTDPLKWMDWIERFQATVTFAPNFAYGLLARHAEEIERRRWDLSSLRFAMNGGEAIVASTARRFLTLLAPHRLSPDVMRPAWGMTETSSAVTYSRRFSLASTRDDDAFVEVGGPIPGVSLRIMGPDDRVVDEGVIGRLQVRGAPVTEGYYQNPQQYGDLFTADGWLETGDSGFLRDGRLTITGRSKDAIIIRGINYSGHEIEAVVEELPGVEASYTAACAVRDPDSQTECLAIFFSPSCSDEQEQARLCAKIREQVVQSIGVNPSYLLPVPKEAIPKTEIGKIKRPQLRERFERGEFQALHRQTSASVTAGSGPAPLNAPRTETERWIARIWQEVLGVPLVGIDDQFFELGGDFLQGAQVIARLQDLLDIDLPLRVLLEASTVREFAQVIAAHDPSPGRTERIAQRRWQLEGLPSRQLVVQRSGSRRTTAEEESSRGSGSALAASDTRRELLSWLLADEAIELHHRSEIARRDDNTEVPLSFAQQRLWFLHQWEPGGQYHDHFRLQLVGPLNDAALELSLAGIVSRHEALRTIFPMVEGQPVQRVTPVPDVALTIVDLAHRPAHDRRTEAERLAAEEARRLFDLAQGPLCRFTLVRLAEEEHLLLLTMHHSVTDGWSRGIFVQELAALYNGFLAGEPAVLPELPIRYADYTRWQRQRLQGDQLEEQLTYWRLQLAGVPEVLQLPTDHPRPAVRSTRGARQSSVLSPALTERLREFSRRENVSLFMTLLAAFQTLLHRYSAQDDIVVGTPIANRSRQELEGLIGFFANTLALRTDLSGNPSFRELLNRARKAALDAYAHQDLPFERLVEELRPTRSASHTPLFQVAFVLQKTLMPPLSLAGLDVSLLEPDCGTAKFDLTLTMVEAEDRLTAVLEYSDDLYDAETITRMLGHFHLLLEGIVSDPEQRLSQLALLTEGERRQLLVEWNASEAAFPEDRCAHELFEAQVERTPDAVAVTSDGRQWTYRELNRRANQVAHSLRRLGVGPEKLVGIYVERSLEMTAGLLGILKAGGAYLPLDPTYPGDRLALMLQDAQVAVLVTQSHLTAALHPHQASILCLDTDADVIAQQSQENPESGVAPDNLAYVIYTSGSSGRPKGALLCHRGLSNLIEVQRHTFAVGPGSRVLQFAPFSFDASVWETFMALASGGTLCLARHDQLAPGHELIRWMRAEAITHVTLPPSVLRLLPREELPALQTVIAAGEACTADLVAQWAPGRAFFNAYGPTETTVCATLHRCDPNDLLPPPIGRPIANTQVYLLDQHRQPVPIGVPGELYVGGVCLARGYRSREELTAEKFTPNPFIDRPGARIYNTGDLARWRPDGNLEFLGRSDQQVKLRGFRIELGEIECVLRQHQAVRECVVLAREDRPGDQRLVAYLVPHPQEAVDTVDLRGLLRQKLPEYMLPTAFLVLEELPHTPSGKVNRRALPAPEPERPELLEQFAAPRTPVEEALEAIWAEVLGLDRVGIHDDFFELGGHSLLATQLVARTLQLFPVELTLRHLFDAPTIAGWADLIVESFAANAPHDQIADLLAG